MGTSMRFIVFSTILVPNWCQTHLRDDILPSSDNSKKARIPKSRLSFFDEDLLAQYMNPHYDEDAFPLETLKAPIPIQRKPPARPVEIKPVNTNIYDANSKFNLFQGDIHPSPVVYSAGQVPSEISHDSYPGRKWPNGKVNIAIDNTFGNFTEAEQREIMKWMGTLMRMTQSCITFNTKPEENDDVIIFSKEKAVCSSSLGRQGPGRDQFIYLGDAACFHKVKMRENGVYFPVVAHELMHALGFLHEHNRNDRDDFIEIHEEHIQPYNLNQFAKDGLARHCTHPYDFKSVLHYGRDAFSETGEYTMTIKGNKKQVIGAKTYSMWDIYDLMEMYCPEKVVVAERLRKMYPDCGMEPNSRRQKKWGGKPAQKDEFPWIAHIQTYPVRNDTPSTRSASFITSGLLVTSASALLKNRTSTIFFDAESLKIHLRPFDKAFNILDTANKQFIKNVTAIHIHPEFKDLGDRQFENDLAIIELEMAIDLDFYKVTPICLPRTNFDPTKRSEIAEKHTNCKMAGWGSDRHKNFTERLHKQELILYEPDVCRNSLGQNFDARKNLCTGNHKLNHPEQNACKGDEGAAVACRNSRQSAYELAGVISWTDSTKDYRHCDRKPWAASNVYQLSTSWLYLLFKDHSGLLNKPMDKCPGGNRLLDFEFKKSKKLAVSGSAAVFPVTTYVECLQKCCDDPDCTAVNHKRSLPKTCQILRVAYTCGEQISMDRFIDDANYTVFRYKKCLYRR